MVKHLHTTNSTSHFLFVNMLTLAEPLMLNHFTVSARINITDPRTEWMGTVTHIRESKRNKGCSQAKLSEINEQLTIRTGWNRSTMKRGLHFSWCSKSSMDAIHFSYVHFLCVCVIQYCCGQMASKKYNRKIHRGHKSHKSWLHPRRVSLPKFILQSVRKKDWFQNAKFWRHAACNNVGSASTRDWWAGGRNKLCSGLPYYSKTIQ